MNIKNNVNTLKTKEKIESSFLTLLQSKEFEKITVKNICESSQINRSTFYFHYKDIYDLMEQIEIKFSDEVDKVFWDGDEKKYKLNILGLLDLIEQHKIFYKVHVNRNGNSIRLDSLKVQESIHKKDNTVKMESLYKMQFFSGGVYAVIKEWLERDCVDKKEKIEEIIMKQFMSLE